MKATHNVVGMWALRRKLLVYRKHHGSTTHITFRLGALQGTQKLHQRRLIPPVFLLLSFFGYLGWLAQA
ncbi:MAG TPA: hypothetical protein VLB46_04980 [Pyrinomonadaceae bacterium]|nr:hypothetical protein [Pyrinomonadaceae bacterium]